MNRIGFLSASSLMTIGIFLLFTTCTRYSGNGFHSSWEKYPDNVWVGPELWANRLADWEVKSGRLTCNSALPMRTVYLLTRRLSSEEGNFVSIVHIKKEGDTKMNSAQAAGILFGAGSSADNRTASLMFNFRNPDAGYFIGLDGAGKVFIRDCTRENYYPEYSKKGYEKWSEAILKITAEKAENGSATVDVIAVDPVTRTVLSELKNAVLPSERFEGGVALVSHPGYNSEKNNSFSLSNWSLRGSRVESCKERSIGPLVGIQYILSRGTLKLTAQLMPVEKDLCDSVEMQLFDEDSWQTVAIEAVDTSLFTAHFKIENWSFGEDRTFRLLARYRFGPREVKTLEGTIRHDPVEKERIKAVAISYESMHYPLNMFIDNLFKQHADLFFIAGDPASAGASAQKTITGKISKLDYLYSWYPLCIFFRDLTSTVPSIIMNSGTQTYPKYLWEDNGRIAECNLGGISLAVTDSFKLFSAAGNNPQEITIADQWFHNQLNAKKLNPVDSLLLLSQKRESAFMKEWADDWSGSRWMKAMLSHSMWVHQDTLYYSKTESDTLPEFSPRDSCVFVTGYTSVVFNKSNMKTELALWPQDADPQKDSPYPGWPVVLGQYNDYMGRVVAWLPEFVFEGMTNPVIRVIKQSTGEIIYSLRISGTSYQPGVFNYGLYTIEAGDPDTGNWKKVENVAAWSVKERQNVIISF